jgi:hypothetical protein
MRLRVKCGEAFQAMNEVGRLRMRGGRDGDFGIGARDAMSYLLSFSESVGEVSDGHVA